MRTYRIRIEGVNFEHFVYDTQDLSTIRGAGLALLWTPHWLQKSFPELSPISVGASSGLFEVELPEAAPGPQPGEAASPIQKLLADLRSFLVTHEEPFRRAKEDEDPGTPRGRFPLGLATFVVDAVEASDFAEDREELLALNRFRQLQSPSLHLEAGDGRAVVGVCNLDRLRPAVADRFAGPGEAVSESVWRRREFGRSQKQDFYQAETGESFPMGFSQTFEDLALLRDGGNLDAKMAVIYIDGNHFGQTQAEICTTVERQKKFDAFLQGNRRAALRRILLRARDEDPGFREGSGEGPIRFETLLWGGDDLLWVVPAWRGLEVVAWFFEKPEVWRLPEDLGGEDRDPLTQAAGVVFCHRGAPIARIRSLAERLAGEAKADRQRNLLAYQVLESFDHTGDDLRAFRESRTPEGLEAETLLLDATALASALPLAARLRDGLPHRKVLELARGLLRDGVSRELESLEKQVRADLAPEFLRDLDPLLEQLGGAEGSVPQLGWLHLAELWDFLGGFLGDVRPRVAASGGRP